MRTNADMTIYNKYLFMGNLSYQRTVITAIAWENRKAVNVLASGGNMKADQVSVYIPLARGTAYLAPKAWQALVTKTDYWTLQTGDVIVKGQVTDEITALFTITDLKAKYDDVLQITVVDTMDSGSASMQHWQLGAS